MNKNQAEGGFFSHLTELRKRLIHSLIFLSILFVICYYFSEYIYGFLVDPYAQAVKNDDTNRRLIFTALQETFLTYLKVSFFAAFFACWFVSATVIETPSPFVFSFTWAFIFCILDIFLLTFDFDADISKYLWSNTSAIEEHVIVRCDSFISFESSSFATRES